MRLWELVKLALGGVRRTPLRVALTALGVAIATGALVSMLAFAVGLQSTIEKPFEKLELLNSLHVSPKSADGERGPRGRRERETSEAPPPAPSGPTAVLDDAAVEKIAALPDVALAYPSSYLAVRIERKERAPVPVFASGYPPAVAKLAAFREGLKAGRFLDGSSPDEMLLTPGLAKRLGFDPPERAVGQKLTVVASGLVPGGTTLFNMEERRVEKSIVGIQDLWSGPFGGMDDRIVLPTAAMKALPGVPIEALDRMQRGQTFRPGELSRVTVWVTRPVELQPVEEKVRAMGFDTWSLAGQVKEMRKVFVLLDALLAAVGAVALVVAGLGIVNTLLMTVLERYAEIGALKALGASEGDVRVLFLSEAGLVGLAGGLGGLGLGRAVSWLIEIGVNAYARSKGVDQAIAAFAFPVWLLLGALVFAIVASVISGVYPASRAARVDPIRALRGE